MRKPTTGQLLPLLLAGTLFSVGCGGDDEGDTMLASQPPPLATFDSSVTTNADASVSLPLPVMDSSVIKPAPVGDAAISSGSDASADGSVTAPSNDAATGGNGECCADKNCVCHGPAPTRLSDDPGPYKTVQSYEISGVGCVYYPADGKPPYAAVAVSDGFGGTGGCRSTQTGGWGRFYGSHGIVVINVIVPSSGVPVRGERLLGGIRALKAENEKSGSPLFGKLAGRYGVSGFSMGGGGSTHAASDDPSLKTSVALMAHQPVSDVEVPTLFTCGSSDPGTLGGCATHGAPAFSRMPAATPKAIVTFNSGHAGNPNAGGGLQGAYALAFQKVFLEGDERWRDLLMSIDFDDSENLE